MREYPIVKKIRLRKDQDNKLHYLAHESKLSEASIVRDLIDKEYTKSKRLLLIKEAVEERKAS